MKIIKCDFCGITSEDESKPYFNTYRQAIFDELGTEVVCFDKVDICEKCKEKLKKKSGNIFKYGIDDYVRDGIREIKKNIKEVGKYNEDRR